MELKKGSPGPTQTRPFNQVCEAQNRLSGATVAFAWPQILLGKVKVDSSASRARDVLEIWTPFLE